MLYNTDKSTQKELITDISEKLFLCLAIFQVLLYSIEI